MKLEDVGATRTRTEVLIREACEECGEDATRRITFLLEDARRNPASSGYRRDDCSWCSDSASFACDEHERKVKQAPPDGMSWCATFQCNDTFAHMFMRWVQRDTALALRPKEKQ